jgi:nicotinate phosphoribosyltransferase
MPNVVLVTDMLRGFMDEGRPLYCGANARRIIPNIQRLLEKEAKAGSRIFYICDHHDPDDPEFKMFPPHCIEGSTETEVIPDFSKFPGEIIAKKRYSAFSGTDLAQKLQKLKPGKIMICGVCTDICVCHTAADARALDYNVEVPADGVASFNEKAHVYALEHMEKVLGVKIIYPSGKALPQPKFITSPAVLNGDTADIYFPRTIEILKKEGINPVAVMEIFASRTGILCGMEEVKALLREVLPEKNSEVWALNEGDTITPKEVVLRIKAPYQSYGLYETAMIGMLAHGTGWATAARECVKAAGNIPVVSFGARHVHPAVAGVMDYAAVVGGCSGCSSVEGGRLTGITPSGTMPHALILVVGDTVKATQLFDKNMAPGVPRVSLVDTFRDEAEESLRVAEALGQKLQSVRLDTPRERGGVTLELVKEVRARLDQAGFSHVGIFVSGGFDPERIKTFVERGAPVAGYGVGSYISGARPVDFTADLHEIDGKPVAKRGRIPGITPNPRLGRVL